MEIDDAKSKIDSSTVLWKNFIEPNLVVSLVQNSLAVALPVVSGLLAVSCPLVKTAIRIITRAFVKLRLVAGR